MRSRRLVIEATLELLVEEGLAAVNVSAVASRAQVSRQTVYSIFGTREALVSQAAVEAVAPVLAAVLEGLDPDDPAAYVTELVVRGRAAVRDQPVMGALIDGLLADPVLDRGTMDAARPVVAGLLAPLAEAVGDLDGLVDLVTRLSLTVVLFDSAHVASDEGLRAFLRRWIEPALRRT